MGVGVSRCFRTCVCTYVWCVWVCSHMCVHGSEWAGVCACVHGVSGICSTVCVCGWV